MTKPNQVNLLRSLKSPWPPPSRQRSSWPPPSRPRCPGWRRTKWWQRDRPGEVFRSSRGRAAPVQEPRSGSQERYCYRSEHQDGPLTRTKGKNSPGQRAQTHQDKGHNSEDQLPARTQTCYILVFELPDEGSSSLWSRSNGEPQNDGNVASEGSATEEKDGSQKKVLPGENLLDVV